MPFSYQLKLQNLGFNFATKWDRTSFFIGYSNVRFGHNPKIDPVTAFVANSLSLDLGFTQDLGVSFKTAISKKYDFEAGLYSGGLIGSPLVTYTPSNLTETDGSKTDFINPEYEGNWLATSRIGSSLFKSFEYGLIAMVGKTGSGSDSRYISRLGFDAVKKFGEKLKIESQIHGGISSYDEKENSVDLAFQSNVEYYIKGMFIISTSHALVLVIPDGESENGKKGSLVNSITYVVSPHTRVRFNQSMNYGSLSNENWSYTFQLVTGIGKR